MNIEIEPSSGFCFGVIKVVEKAETGLMEQEKLYSLGDIVHNEAENKRLQEQGLIPIDHDTFKKLKNTTVLLRAHGEPPETYEIARQNNIELIEGTCPIVLKLQERVKRIQQLNPHTNIIIFGKKDHPEVVGLSGQVGFNTQIVSHVEEVEQLDLHTPIYLLSQTTMPGEEYQAVQEQLRKILKNKNINVEENLKCLHSVCGKVANRRNKVAAFAREKDVIIFVAGKKSANGKQLFEVCHHTNSNSYFISSTDELQPNWFRAKENIGICGATSTPQWLLQDVARAIGQITGQHGGAA